MKRYYLCDIIGDGTEMNEFRAAVQDFPGVSHVAVIPVDMTTGRPKFPWALVLVEAKNHAQLLNDSRIDALPDFPLDAKVNALNNAAKDRLTAALQRRGIGTTLVNNSDGYRDVIRGIGQVLQPSFSEDNFDVLA